MTFAAVTLILDKVSILLSREGSVRLNICTSTVREPHLIFLAIFRLLSVILNLILIRLLKTFTNCSLKPGRSSREQFPSKVSLYTLSVGVTAVVVVSTPGSVGRVNNVDVSTTVLIVSVVPDVDTLMTLVMLSSVTVGVDIGGVTVGDMLSTVVTEPSMSGTVDVFKVSLGCVDTSTELDINTVDIFGNIDVTIACTRDTSDGSDTRDVLGDTFGDTLDDDIFGVTLDDDTSGDTLVGDTLDDDIFGDTLDDDTLGNTVDDDNSGATLDDDIFGDTLDDDTLGNTVDDDNSGDTLDDDTFCVASVTAGETVFVLVTS